MLIRARFIIENRGRLGDGEGRREDLAGQAGIKLDPFARELFAVPLAAAANRNYANYASWQF